MQAASITHGCTAIGGGGLETDKFWLVRPESLVERNGVSYVKLERSNARFAEFVGHKFDMMDRIVDLRNKACDAVMYAAEQNGDVDPLAGVEGVHHEPKKRKAAFAECSANAITVTVKTTKGEEVSAAPRRTGTPGNAGPGRMIASTLAKITNAIIRMKLNVNIIRA